MRKPWQIWTVYAFCLVLAVSGMSWLTAKALELDPDNPNLTIGYATLIAKLGRSDESRSYIERTLELGLEREA